MDIIPKFYIFGVPDGFDILDGTPAETTYFQKFYNDSKENTKFSIHRDTKGNITYTYLRYNLSSGESRTGSFFGMSLMFHNVYTANPLLLYELFDWVYNEQVLVGRTKNQDNSSDGLLIPISGNKDIQARYNIKSFQEKRDYIKRTIEKVLIGNILTEKFKKDFHEIDGSFSNDCPNGAAAQEPMQTVSNDMLLADLRQYYRVAVSPDWLAEPDSNPAPNSNQNTGKDKITNAKIVLAPEYIVSLLEYIKVCQNYIINSLNDIEAADLAEANTAYKEVTVRLKEVQTTPSSDKRVPQIIRDYTALSEQLQSLIQKIEEGPTPPPTPPTPWWKNPKILGIMGIAVIVVITLVSIIVINNNKQKEKEKATQEEQVQIIADVRNYINVKEFQKARKIVWKIDEPLCVQLADSIIFCELNDISAKKGFKDFTSTWKKYVDEFSGDNSEIKQRTIDTIANRRWRYIEKLVKNAETTKKQNDINVAEKAINAGMDTELHDETIATSYKQRLNSIIIQQSESHPRQRSKKETSNYTIKIWKTDETYSIEGAEKKPNPNNTATGTMTITLEKDQYYTCQILNNNGTFQLNGRIDITSPSKSILVKNDWVHIFVPASGFSAEEKIKIDNITITFNTK